MAAGRYGFTHLDLHVTAHLLVTAQLLSCKTTARTTATKNTRYNAHCRRCGQYTPFSDQLIDTRLVKNAVVELAGYQGAGCNSIWRMLLSCSDQSRRHAGYSELLKRRVIAHACTRMQCEQQSMYPTINSTDANDVILVDLITKKIARYQHLNNNRAI